MMWKLAYNDKAVLIKTDNGEYWYIEADFDRHGCINSQSKDYHAKEALEFFIGRYGPVTWTHKNIQWM